MSGVARIDVKRSGTDERTGQPTDGYVLASVQNSESGNGTILLRLFNDRMAAHDGVGPAQFQKRLSLEEANSLASALRTAREFEIRKMKGIGEKDGQFKLGFPV